MKILVVSDIHENFLNLKAVLQFAEDQNITKGFALGDFINPGIIHQLGRSGIEFELVLGNNDGDIFLIYKAVENFSNLKLEDLYSEHTLDKQKVFITHYDKIGELAAKSGDYDSVFYGHTHQAKNKLLRDCLLVNPGEVSGHIFGKPSFGVWNSKTNEFQLYTIDGKWADVKKYKRSTTIINDIQINLASVEDLQ